MSIPASLFQNASSARIVLDRPKRLRDVLPALDAGGIALWPNQHEVVAHHRKSFDAFAFGDKLQFCYFGMYEYDIGFTTPASIKCLTGPQLQHFHGNAGLLREDGKQVIKQARVYRRSS